MKENSGKAPLWGCLRVAAKDFVDDDAPQAAAALSFYAITALPPLIISILSVISLAVDTASATKGLVSQVSSLFGSSVGKLIGDIIANRSDSEHGAAALVSLLMLVFTASGFFGQLQKALNKAWEVKPKAKVPLLATLRKRLLSATAVLGTGFLLLISLLLSTAVAAFSGLVEARLGISANLAEVGQFVVLLAITLVLFTLIFKYLPDATIGWKVAFKGAAGTTVLFLIGKFALGWYLGRGDFASDYGPAGALVLLSLWVYYSSMLLLYGAELSQAFAQAQGETIEPEPFAEKYQEVRVPESRDATTARPAELKQA